MNVIKSLRDLATGVILTLFAAGAALAAELSAPAGDPVLTVTGAIASANKGEAAVFDMDMLKAMPATEFETTTIWTEGTHRFRGVALNTLLDAVGANGATLRATALNDYAVEIPAADARDGGPILAYLMDGAEMPSRTKGPLWVVYPFDSDVAYRNEITYSRSIWQLDRIQVLR